MKKKLIGLTALLLIGCFLFVGCGSSDLGFKEKAESWFDSVFDKDSDSDATDDFDKNAITPGSDILSVQSKAFVTKYIFDETNNVYRLVVGFDGLSTSHKYTIKWKCDTSVFENVSILPSTNGNEYALAYCMDFGDPTFQYIAVTDSKDAFLTVCEENGTVLNTASSTCIAISFWQVSGDTSLAVRHELRTLIEQNVEIYLYG